MKKTIRLAQIGNSKGIRLSKRILERYGIEGTISIEETPDAIVLTPVTHPPLSWEDTFRAMSEEEEDWSDFERLEGADWPHGE